MKKILLLLIAVSIALSLSACLGGSQPCKECVDKNGDGICDKCENEIKIGRAHV